jgi:hypothetical protein
MQQKQKIQESLSETYSIFFLRVAVEQDLSQVTRKWASHVEFNVLENWVKELKAYNYLLSTLTVMHQRIEKDNPLVFYDPEWNRFPFRID